MKNAPTVNAMTKNGVEQLKENPIFSMAIEQIIDEITVSKFNIKTFLSNVEEKKNIIGTGDLEGLDKNQFEQLAKEIQELRHKEVSIHEIIT